MSLHMFYLLAGHFSSKESNLEFSFVFGGSQVQYMNKLGSSASTTVIEEDICKT